MDNHQIIFIMGVSGSGKSTIGRGLAERLAIEFFDGDDFHSKANIAKMASEHPLNDEDRKPWLEAINEFSRRKVEKASIVVACSALKASYRAILSSSVRTTFVYLKGSFAEIWKRMEARKDHFMPVELLKSQFADLEEPEGALVVSVNQTVEEIVEDIVGKLILKST